MKQCNRSNQTPIIWMHVSLFKDPFIGWGNSSHWHRHRSSHPGDHSHCVWQLHYSHHRPSSQHSDELQQSHGHGQRPGEYKCSMSDCETRSGGWNSIVDVIFPKLLCVWYDWWDETVHVSLEQFSRLLMVADNMKSTQVVTSLCVSALNQLSLHFWHQ